MKLESPREKTLPLEKPAPQKTKKHAKVPVDKFYFGKLDKIFLLFKKKLRSKADNTSKIKTMKNNSRQ